MNMAEHHSGQPVVVSGGGSGGAVVGIVAIVVLLIIVVFAFMLFTRGPIVLPRGLIEIFVAPPQQQQPIIVPVPQIQPTSPGTSATPTRPY
jgi:hypothetical protein